MNDQPPTVLEAQEKPKTKILYKVIYLVVEIIRYLVLAAAIFIGIIFIVLILMIPIMIVSPGDDVMWGMIIAIAAGVYIYYLRTTKTDKQELLTNKRLKFSAPSLIPKYAPFVVTFVLIVFWWSFWFVNYRSDLSETRTWLYQQSEKIIDLTNTEQTEQVSETEICDFANNENFSKGVSYCFRILEWESTAYKDANVASENMLNLHLELVNEGWRIDSEKDDIASLVVKEVKSGFTDSETDAGIFKLKYAQEHNGKRCTLEIEQLLSQKKITYRMDCGDYKYKSRVPWG